MTQTDEIVDPDLIHEALVVVGQMDADNAIKWLRATEDTLAMHIHREGINVASRLEENRGLKLNVVQRAASCTAVAAVVAVQAADHELRRDRVAGPKTATVEHMYERQRDTIAVVRLSSTRELSCRELMRP